MTCGASSWASADVGRERPYPQGVSTAAAETASEVSGVQVAQPVLRKLRSMERQVAAAVTRTILRIPQDTGKPIRLDVPDDPPGREYLALLPDLQEAPAVIYRRENPGWLVTALMDRDKYRAYRQAEQKGLLDDPVVRFAATAALVAAGIYLAGRALGQGSGGGTGAGVR